ncbi:hypothetical protein JW835_13645 [bacterium]|nr:hypothetical protein [bacterium]
MRKFLLIHYLLIIMTYPLTGQKVVRVTKNYAALQNENVGAKGEQLIIRRSVKGKLTDIGLVRVLISKQGKTAVKIIKEFGSYHIRPGDYAFRISVPHQIKPQSIQNPWRFRLGAGPGRRIGNLAQNVPPGFQSYCDKLKSGYSFFSDIAFYTKPSHGFGWAFSQWQTSHEADGQIIYDNETGFADYLGNIQNNIKIFYTGPVLVIQHFLPNSKIQVNGSITAGWLKFQDKQKIVTSSDDTEKISNDKISDQTFGIGGNIGLSYQFSDSYGMFGHFMFLFGTVPRQSTESNLYQDRICLNRLDIHIGIMLPF